MKNKTCKRVIIDTDAGVMNGVSIAVATSDDRLDIKLVTTVAGRTSVDQSTKNVLKILTFLEKNIPVAIGADQALLGGKINKLISYENELIDGNLFPASNYELLAKNHAVIEMSKMLLSSKQKTTIVAMGPLTNIALLLRLFPESINKIEELIIITSPISQGITNKVPEWNIALDPEAAEIVFSSEIVKTVLSVENKSDFCLFGTDNQAIKEMNRTGNMLARIVNEYYPQTSNQKVDLRDSCAIAYLTNPEMFEIKPAFVDVETRGKITSGMTVIDVNGHLRGEINCYICVSVEEGSFREWFLDSLSKCV